MRGLLPTGAVVDGPVDTTASVGSEEFRTCLEVVAQDDGVDAVMAITVRTALGDLAPAVCAATSDKPLVAVMLDQQESVRLLRDPDGPDGRAVPAYLYPESAARALGHAARYSAWRAASPGEVPELAGLKPDTAREIVAGFLAGQRLGGWLPPGQVADLLACYGIRLAGAGVGAGAGGGIELIIAVRQEPVFGPLVSFGLGGGLPEVLQDKTARLAPLTDTDADQLIRGIKAAPLLTGDRGTAPVDLAALAELLLRVSRLADDVTEVTELKISPVIASPDGIYPRNARVRLAPAEPQDPFLRRLR